MYKLKMENYVKPTLNGLKKNRAVLLLFIFALAGNNLTFGQPTDHACINNFFKIVMADSLDESAVMKLIVPDKRNNANIIKALPYLKKQWQEKFNKEEINWIETKNKTGIEDFRTFSFQMSPDKVITIAIKGDLIQSLIEINPSEHAIVIYL